MDHGMMGVDWEQRIDYDRLREERLTKARGAIADSDLDYMLVLRLEDVRYLTGFRMHLAPVVALGWAGAALATDGDLVLYTIDEVNSRARMPWLNDDQIDGRPNVRERPGIAEWASRLKRRFSDIASARIGIDVWTPTIEAGLKEAFPEATFVDGYPTLLKAKLIKTADEIACLETATAITEAGFQAALDVLRPGVRECEVLAAAWGKMTALGSEWTQCANIVASGPNTAPYRRLTSDRIIRAGDLVVIDIGGCFNGYWGDFTRTWICGDAEPSERQVELHQRAYDSLFSACAAAEPGKTNHDVFKAAHGNVLGDSLGHGSGTNPWEPPFFSSQAARDPMTLEVGMTMNLEPYVGDPEVGGFRVENNLLVTESGPRVYTTFPFDERLLASKHPLDAGSGKPQATIS